MSIIILVSYILSNKGAKKLIEAEPLGKFYKFSFEKSFLIKGITVTCIKMGALRELAYFSLRL